MRVLRTGYVVICALLLVSSVGAQEKSKSAFVVDRTLTISPREAPVPALRYRLLPLSSELKEGNAVPIYLRLAHAQSDEERKSLTETPKPWNLLPVDQVPREEARKYLGQHNYLRRQLEIGVRRRVVEWNYTLDEPDPIGLLLPDLQAMRNYLPLLRLQSRLAIAEGDFAAATHHLATGFAFCRHVAEGPTLLHKLVGLVMARELTGTVADFVERPGAPNLCWALTALPGPFIDLRGPLEWEYQMLELQIPEFNDLERERTPEQWNVLLRRVRTELARLADGHAESPSKISQSFPKGAAPTDPAAKSPDLSAARAFVARNKGWSAEKIASLPPAQVLLLYIHGTYREDRDDWYRAAPLPFAESLHWLNAASKRLRESPVSEGHLPARLLLPALDRVKSQQCVTDRCLAALRVIEALRMYAAAHAGNLPDSLSQVTEAPLPLDPGTRQPFEYRVEGGMATLVSQIPGDPMPNSGVRYRLSIRKE